MSCTVDSPQSTLYCMDPGDTLPIQGSCSNVTAIWVSLSSGTCGPFPANPIQAGIGQVSCSGGTWSSGTLSGSDLGQHCLRVWCLDDDSLSISLTTVEFEIAAAGSPSCYGMPVAGAGQAVLTQARGSARTRHAAPAAPAAPLSAIKQSAPRRMRVTIPASALQLSEAAAWLRDSGALKLPSIELEYCPRSSSVRQAVWTGNGGSRAEVWRLEAKRNGSGQLRATLAMQRLCGSRVLPPLVWTTGSFCFKNGGRLRCTTAAQVPMAIVEAAS